MNTVLSTERPTCEVWPAWCTTNHDEDETHNGEAHDLALDGAGRRHYAYLTAEPEELTPSIALDFDNSDLESWQIGLASADQLVNALALTGLDAGKTIAELVDVALTEPTRLWWRTATSCRRARRGARPSTT